MKISDRQLVERVRNGDVQAFGELVTRYRDMVYGLGYHLTGNFDSAQDLAQEALVQAYLKLDQLHDPNKFPAWLRQIATNVHRNIQRRQEVPTVAIEEVHEMADTQHPSEIEVVVREALSRLRKPERLAITLHYINGYSYNEIGTFLGIRPETVKTRLARARQHLREEVMAMVEDTFDKKKLPDEFTRETVETAIQKAREAHQQHRRSEAVQRYEEAIAVLDQAERSEENLRLRLNVIRHKAAEQYNEDFEEAAKGFNDALRLARQIGDRKEEAESLLLCGQLAVRLPEELKQSENLVLQALEIYREIKDLEGQIHCLEWVVQARGEAGDISGVTVHLEELLRLSQQTENMKKAVSAQAGLNALYELTDRCSLLYYLAYGCNVVEKQGVVLNRTNLAAGSVSVKKTPFESPVRMPGVFTYIDLHEKFLDSAVQLGDSWSEDIDVFTWFEGIRSTWTVRNLAERVTCPAGTFENCLLVEKTIPPLTFTEKTPPPIQQIWKDTYMPLCQFWYAPGVGLVKVFTRKEDGTENTITLKEYSITEPTIDYFPLALGNWWSFVWEDLPADHEMKELHRVVANEGDTWYLEHYHYVLGCRTEGHYG